jgi:hypothetical protein
MARRKRKANSFRKLIRSAYRALGLLNTASYILNAGSSPGKLVKHVARQKTSKLGSRLIR